MFSEEERKQRIREIKRRYYASEKGKECRKREEAAYKASGKRAENERRRSQRPLSEARKEARRRWARKNKHYSAADRAYRRMLARSPISKLHKAEIEEIYLQCSQNPGHHVDHIVPIKGANVSGLHVPWNLQIITQKENRIKGNRVPQDAY